MKKRFAQLVLVGFTLTVMLTQFTNCGNYAQPFTVDGSSVLACTTTNCIMPTPTELSVTPHLPNGQYSVTANLAEFNIGGDCNEGGYPSNVVHWDLMLNGVVVRSSSMQVAGTSTADSRCLNGRFLLYVNLAPVSQDNVDRTGLSTGTGARSAYNLRVSISGLNTVNGLTTQTAPITSLVPLAAI